MLGHSARFVNLQYPDLLNVSDLPDLLDGSEMPDASHLHNDADPSDVPSEPTPSQNHNRLMSPSQLRVSPTRACYR